MMMSSSIISNCRQRLLLSGSRIRRRRVLLDLRYCCGGDSDGSGFRHHHQHQQQQHQSLPWRSLNSNTSRPFSTQQELNDDNAKKTARNWENELLATTTSSSEPISSRRLYRYLHLEMFTEEEFQERFEEIVSISSGGSTATTITLNEEIENASSSLKSSSLSTSSQHLEDQEQNIEITRENLESYLENVFQEMEKQNSDNFQSKYNDQDTKSIRQAYAAMEAQRCWDYFAKSSSNITKKIIRNDSTISKDEFVTILTQSASTIDIKKILPLTTSMLLVGSSVGVVTPAMPFVVQNLGLTAGEYGLVVSAFALAKMTGNIPSAVLVERYGRKVSSHIRSRALHLGIIFLNLFVFFSCAYILTVIYSHI